MPAIPISILTDSSGGCQPIWLNWFNAVYRLVSASPTISTGILPPTTTPGKVGDMFVDTAATKVYISTGVISAADWQILN